MTGETLRQQAQRHRRAREMAARRSEAARARELAKRSAGLAPLPERSLGRRGATWRGDRAGDGHVDGPDVASRHGERGQRDRRRPDDDEQLRRRPWLEPVYPRGSIQGPIYDRRGQWIRPALPAPIGYLDPDTGRLVRTEALTA